MSRSARSLRDVDRHYRRSSPRSSRRHGLRARRGSARASGAIDRAANAVPAGRPGQQCHDQRADRLKRFRCGPSATEPDSGVLIVVAPPRWARSLRLLELVGRSLPPVFFGVGVGRVASWQALFSQNPATSGSASLRRRAAGRAGHDPMALGWKSSRSTARRPGRDRRRRRSGRRCVKARGPRRLDQGGLARRRSFCRRGERAPRRWARRALCSRRSCSGRRRRGSPSAWVAGLACTGRGYRTAATPAFERGPVNGAIPAQSARAEKRSRRSSQPTSAAVDW